MKNVIKAHRYKCLFFVLSLIIVCAGIKLCYLGWEDYRFRNAGDYEVVAYKTIWHPYSLLVTSRDADGGFYRIFDKDGHKVFELFSKSFNFDVVITSDEGVEFQLDDGTHYWRIPSE